MDTLRQRLRFLCAMLLSMSALLVVTGTAFAQADHPQLPAHASVLKAIPAIGSTISQAPTTVTVFTAENINPDPAKSNLLVYGPSGEATARLISHGKVLLHQPRYLIQSGGVSRCVVDTPACLLRTAHALPLPAF